MLTSDIVHTALQTRRITKHMHVLLLRALAFGTTDPVQARLSKGLVRTWFELEQEYGGQTRKLNQFVSQAMKKFESRLSQNSAPIHRSIVSTLHTLRYNDQLGSYLEPWFEVTQDHPSVLEAVVWIWLYSAGYAPEDPPPIDNHGDAPPMETARSDPAELIRVLAQFKRQYDVRGMNPAQLVDTLALKHDWWVTGDEMRSDVLLYASVCESLSEHEWIPSSEVETYARTLHADERAVERFLAGDRLVTAGEDAARITLRNIYDTSARVKCIARSLNETFPVANDAWVVSDEVKRTLTDEQMTLVTRVAEGNRLTLVCAPAGTGKTHAAMALATTTPSNATVLCLAPTHKALSVLRKKFAALSHTGVTMEFMTVHRFSLLTEEVTASLVIVDETSMITMPKILSILESFFLLPNTRLLFMGDDAQLPCIGRGLPIRDLQDCIFTLRFTRCMRTEGQSLISLATAVRTGGTVNLEETPQLQVTDEKNMDLLMDAIVDAYRVVKEPWDSAYMQIITPQNKHVQELNVRIQRRIVRDQTKPSASVSGCFVGDAVRIKRNTPVYKNGDEGVLEDIVPAGVEDIAMHSKNKRSSSGDLIGIVRLQNGSHVRVWKFDMDPAYATTVHKVQGSEYPHVVLAMFTNIHPNLRTREILYTSVTRARDRLHIMGDSAALRRMISNPRRTVFATITDEDCTPETWHSKTVTEE
tara:strand:+ start:695 stop:2797 length:2103 start_codon:yes stop_codon:yes gene_type:complete